MSTKCTNVSLNHLIYVQTVVKSCPVIFLEGSAGQTVVQSRALALVRGFKLHITLFVPLCPKINKYLGIDMNVKDQLHFSTE